MNDNTRENMAAICGIELPALSAAPIRTLRALDLVSAERLRQISKWGDDSGNTLFAWASILGEEFGELCEAINETCFRNPTHPEKGGHEKILKEATQVAAVAVSIMESTMAILRK